MGRPDFDAIVVGAGVGGAAAAYFLTRAGLKVLVIERARLPRYKACGGAIPRPTLDSFSFSFDSVIQAAPTSVRFCFPGQPAVQVPLPDKPVVMVMREEFDALLLAQSGAEVLDGHPVTGVIESGGHVQVQTAARSFTGRYAVGADGAASSVARWLGLREHRQLSPTLEAEVAPSRAAGRFAEYGQQAVFSLGVVPWGYAWVFPKNGALSVGIGRVRPGRLDLRAALWREMERLGLPPAGVELHGHPLPCYQAPLWPLWSPWVRGARPVPGWPQERLSTDRCLLVGDAAGLVDPLIGEGIRYAIGSARLAAEAIASGDLSSYEAAVWRDIGHSLATARLTAGVAYQWPKLSFQLGVRNPATTHLFVKILTGQTSHVGTGRKILGNAARWLLRGEPD